MTSPKFLQNNSIANLEISSSLLKYDWHPIKIEDKTFSFKHCFDSESFELLVLDLSKFQLLHTKQEKTEILDTFKKLNPGLEAPLSKLLSHLKDALLSTEINSLFEAKKKSDESKKITWELVTKLAGVKFYWAFELNLIDPNAFRDQLVVPLLFNICEYHQREIELIKIINNKDKELDDYKSQGIKLTRKYLSTEPFSVEQFDGSMNKRTMEMGKDISPERCLYTDLSHKVNQACSQKYYQTVEKRRDESQVEEETKPSQSSSSSEASKSESEKKSLSQKTETAKRRELELLEEEKSKASTSKKSNQKKKKLF